ncbi:MAG: alpha-amylase family glycosyl hydrolase [Ilumatobacteraceae bacterium]
MRISTAAAVLASCGVVAACSAPSDSATPTVVTEPTVSVAPPPGETDPDPMRVEEEQPPPDGFVADPVRHPATADSIYFVMPDRFADGDPTNNTGGVSSIDDPMVHGYDPTDTGWYHGGDLRGLTDRLDYIAGLGTNAIWITPPFRNNWVQGNGTPQGSSAGYHGYWQIDWSMVDPHLGTEADLIAFVAAAQERGMRVYFDVVVNHTGDVISFEEDSYVYWSLSARPYLDVDGDEFDPADVAGTPEFPVLDAATSFPYTPTFADPASATAKFPDWLDDVTRYHNRGNSSFQGESSNYGDFYGLDDLFTEDPFVVEAMTDLQASLVERYGIDGFRIDTMKHVNIEFWEHFAPTVLERARDAGRPEFFMFGEVASTDPILASTFTNVGVPATLDFGLAAALEQYVALRGNGSVLAGAFDDDDWYTDADNNASMQVTFFGNHDAGRMGYLISRADHGADDAELLDRMRLGFALLHLVRGVPVVYSGDEQGFTGTGGDQLARQDMFPTATPEYADDDSIGTDATPADDNFDVGHPLYRFIAELNALRRAHPTLVTGSQIVHHTDGPVFAASRIDRTERIEYVVATNSNGSLAVPTNIDALSADTEFDVVFGELVGGPTVRSDPDGALRLEVPPVGFALLRARTPVPVRADPPAIRLVRPDAGAEIPTTRYRLEATVPDGRYAEVTFTVSVDGGPSRLVGVDDAPPYRVYWNNAAIADGAVVEVRATVVDGSGRWGTDTVEVTLGVRR